jgi:F plasmid transfer operon, TraF, protein
MPTPFAPPRNLVLAACAVSLLWAGDSRSQMPFSPFGARSVALGGASVGLGPDIAAGIDNPAAVPDGNFAFTVSAGLLTRESGDFLAPLRVLSGNNPATLASGSQPQSFADVVQALRTLGDPGNGFAGNGLAGLAIAHGGWQLSFTDWGFSGLTARTDLVHTALGTNPATSIAFNDSAAAFRGLELKDLALSKSMSFFLGRVTVGASVHALFGSTFTKEEPAFTTEVGEPWNLAQRALTGRERTHTDFSFDLGGLVSLGPVHVGGVWRGINKPTFPFADDGPAADRGRSVTYGQQARIGASVKIPIIGLLVAADYDLTVNETLVDNLRVRQVGGGVEWTILLVVVRGGVSVNLESPDRTPAFTGGAGVTIGPAKVDLGGWYRTDKSALGLTLTARVGL